MGDVEYIVAILAILCLLAMALGEIRMVQEVLSSSIEWILCRHWNLDLCCLCALCKWIAEKRTRRIALTGDTLLIRTAWETIPSWLVYLWVG